MRKLDLSEARVAVIGGGIGGLAAAISLAASGHAVTLLERAPDIGGKMRVAHVAGRAIDAGPTVLTMPSIFEEIFARAGERLADHVRLTRSELLARHWWPDGGTLDLFSDRARSADAIGAFAGPDAARGYLDFSARAARVWDILEHSYIRAPRPSLPVLMARAGPRRLLGVSPFSTLDRALARHFADTRLRQLFGRYATYCGSSPYASPATLMLVAHLETRGVWLVDGGMHALARALASLAARCGVSIRLAATVVRIVEHRGRATGVELASGERIDADAVVCNADAQALASGLLGPVRQAARLLPDAARSLSALTWAGIVPRATAPLDRHNVFFSGDYRAEFDDLGRRRMLPRDPTIYVCAQDRPDLAAADAEERVLCLVNAPPAGRAITAAETERCRRQVAERLGRMGIAMPDGMAETGPAGFATMFPGTKGALYGANAHGWRASFRRPGARTRIPGLYLAGGFAHPGPGVPMAAISGMLAASALTEDLASTSRSRRIPISGGTSTR